MCSALCMVAPHVVSPSLTLSFRPHMAECTTDVCPSPLLAEGLSFCCSPRNLAPACCCVCNPCPGSCTVGSPCDPPVFGHKNTARFVCLFFVWLWPGRDTTTRTPARAWKDEVLCCRAPCATCCPSCHPCCVLVFAFCLDGWAASGAPLHPTYSTCGTSDSCMVGLRRGVATSTPVWPAIPRLPGPPLRGPPGPARALSGGQPRMIQSGAPGRQLSLDDPVRGTAAPAACSAPDDPVRGVWSYFTG